MFLLLDTALKGTRVVFSLVVMAIAGVVATSGSAYGSAGLRA